MFDVREITKLVRYANLFSSNRRKNDELSFLQTQVVRFVVKKPGCTQDEIVQHTHIDKSALSRIIVILVKRNYVERQENPKDRRSRNLFPTVKALTAKQDQTDDEEVYYSWLLSHLDPKERDVFVTTLHKLYSIAKQERQHNFDSIKAIK